MILIRRSVCTDNSQGLHRIQEPDNEEAAPDEEASNQKEKACSDSAAEVEVADSTDELPDEKTEENASSDEGISLADSILDIDAEESHKTADEAAAESKDSDFDPFSLDEDDSATFGLEDEAEKPSEGTTENVNTEPEEDDSLTIDETSDSEALTEETEQQNTDDCEEDDGDEGAEAILID